MTKWQNVQQHGCLTGERRDVPVQVIGQRPRRARPELAPNGPDVAVGPCKRDFHPLESSRERSATWQIVSPTTTRM